MPDPLAAPAGVVAGVAGGCVRLEPPVAGLTGVNVGGLTIVPAGVPGATVGAGAAVACDARPVNACCSSGPSFSARWFDRLKT